MKQLEEKVNAFINSLIIKFDKTPGETLTESIEDAVHDLGLDRKMYLEDMLRRAELLECYNVCVVVRDLLKK
jgi:hypothetical protein